MTLLMIENICDKITPKLVKDLGVTNAEKN